MTPFVTALAAAAALLSSPALAAPDTLMRVDLSGIDLATHDGAQTALARITSVATANCKSAPTGTRMQKVSDSCVEQMVGQAVKQLNAPTVTALHDSTAASRLAGKVKQGS